jgi:hypothetical protein
MSTRLNGLSMTMAAFIALIGIFVWLDFIGFQPQDLEFFGAKALVARYGPEPRMQAIGIVFPPILVYGTLILGSPITLQVVLGALSVGCLVRSLTAVPMPWGWRWSWLGLILVQPAFALMLIVSPAWTLSTSLLILVSTILWSFVEAESGCAAAPPPSLLSLVLFGLGLASLMLLRFEAWLLLPLMGGIVGLIYRRRSWPFRSTIIAVTLFMSFVFIGAWFYANWLFTGEMAFFLNSPYSGLRQPGTERVIQQTGFVDSWQEAITWVASVVPAYVVMAAWVLWRARRRVLVTLILLIPVLFPAAALWQGSFTPQLSRFGIALGMLPVLWRYYPPTRLWQRCFITATLLMGLYTGAQLLQQGRIAPEDTYLWHKLTGQAFPQGSSVPQWIEQQLMKRRVASALNKHLLPHQRVLMDDVTNFPVVYLVNDPRHFIMPYQYEFSPALQHPDLFADFILVSGAHSPGKDHDRILQFWPQLEHGVLPTFTELVTTPDYRLLQRITPP